MHPLTPLITYSNDHFSPGSPPTHLSPEIDPKTGESPSAQVGPHAGLQWVRLVFTALESGNPGFRSHV